MLLSAGHKQETFDIILYSKKEEKETEKDAT